MRKPVKPREDKTDLERDAPNHRRQVGGAGYTFCPPNVGLVHRACKWMESETISYYVSETLDRSLGDIMATKIHASDDTIVNIS